MSMGEQNSVLRERETEPQWDDYESNLDPINNVPDREPLSSLHNDKYIYRYYILIHKYKRDIQRMNELRNQVVLLFTAMGFLVSFFLSSAFEFFWGGPISFLGYLVIVFLFGNSCILIRAFSNTTKNLYEYPGSKFLDECQNSFQDAVTDLREECRQLSEIIQYNSKKNEELPTDLIISTLILVICFFIVFSLYIVFRIWEVESDISWIPLILSSIFFIVLYMSFHRWLAN